MRGKDLQQFSMWIKGIAVYLIKPINLRGGYKYHECSITEYEDIDSVRQYDGYILKEYNKYGGSIYRGSRFFFKSPNVYHLFV